MRLTSKVVVLRSLVCLVIQPALFFGMIKLAELTGTIAQATFVGSTMPPATLSFMFAQQHATYETESVGASVTSTEAGVPKGDLGRRSSV